MSVVKIPRFSMREFLLAVALVSLVLALFVQQRQLRDATRSLARYEKQHISTKLSPGTFRVIQTVVLDHSDAKVIQYRIESPDQRFVEFRHDSDAYGCTLGYDADTELYFTQMTVSVSHLASEQLLKVVAGGGGMTLRKLPSGYSLDNDLVLHSTDGVYAQDAAVEVFRLRDPLGSEWWPYMLQFVSSSGTNSPAQPTSPAIQTP